MKNPPAKPLLIWDGECHFCARWIARWKQMTGDRVEYITSQELGDRFREIPRELFARAVVLIEPTGEVLSAAAAVCRSLGQYGGRPIFEWSYRHLPGFAPIAEAGYRVVAKNRSAASTVTRLLWGNDVRVPTYFTARRWFLRMLGVVYLIAFVSLWVQVDGLIGSNGISPVAQFLPAARAQIGGSASFVLPTLCWFNASDAMLHFLCGAGAVISVLLIVGIAPLLSLALLFVLYLSLSVAGQTFLQFQWDILLLEAGFLALSFAPLQWRMRKGREAPVSRVGLFLLRFLLFKLMLMSGVVKLSSYLLLPDASTDTWWNLTALDYHYWTQPLPTALGWWAANTSEWLKHFCTATALIIETVVPFLIWAPRRLRFLGFVLLVALQLMIALTGNYCFFNLLTIALCLLMLDDVVLRKPLAAVADCGLRNATLPVQSAAVSDRGYSTLRWGAVVVLLVTMPVNAMLLYSAFRPKAEWPRSITALEGIMEPFRIVNGYGLFRVMTTTRPEIEVEGSADGFVWKPYVFKWKPGPLDRAPGFVAPHQPRLDWQMWFAALGDFRSNPWFVRLMRQLLENAPPVTGLLKTNPFSDAPPRYIRATLYQYRFTDVEEHRQTGDWWKRERVRPYFPEATRSNWR